MVRTDVLLDSVQYVPSGSVGNWVFRDLFLTAVASQNVLLKRGQSLRVRQILDWASPSGSFLERTIYTPSPRRKITCSVQP